jgi:prolyl-tRNA synthetase
MTQKKESYAISPTRDEDYPEWYQQVLKAGDLAENSAVRGCMVIKPWGYAIWENMQRIMDAEIKRTGHQNAYFPLFIPLSFFEKEAAHVQGFAKECAVVTHHRLEEQNGKLVPSGELEEPLVVRPTSETIIGDCFSRWIKSYRDLPVLINQWCNVVRWEMRTRLFLRTTEFLWQEGHTAHATEEEAREETLKMLEMYRSFAEDTLAMPVITGEKTPGERFPGAVATYCIEGMMYDRKALQAGTSHYLGQNFAKASDIKFSSKEGSLDYVHTSSWGTSTRMIGGLVMTHSDDDGLRLPPKVAPKHVVILPVVPKPELETQVFAYADQLASEISKQNYSGRPVEVFVDKRDIRGGEKSWEWIKKGVPLRIEIGPRDIESQSAMLCRRDMPHKEKTKISLDRLAHEIPNLLTEIQNRYFQQALEYRNRNITTAISNFEELKRYFTPKNPDKPEIHGGFVLGKWCGDPSTEALLTDLKVTIRCIPLDQSGKEGKCVLTGKPAVLDVIFGKSY